MWKWLWVPLLLLLAGGGYFWQMRDSARRVDIVTVERGVVESTLQLTGIVINDRLATLTALLDGEIMAIHAREGDVVEAEQLLAELDSRQAQALLDKAQAELVLQEQTLAAAERDVARITRLSRAGNASRQTLDESRDALLAAQAALKAAQATLELNRLRRENAEVRSPYAGTVISKSAEAGQWLEAGTQLFQVVASEGTVIEADVSASDWARIEVGQTATLSSESNDTQWHSNIIWMSPRVVQKDGQGRTVAIRMPPGDDAPALLLGQEVDVDVTLQRLDDVLVVPLSVVQETLPDQFRVFVLAQGTVGSVVEERQVSTGLSSLNEVQIVEGLAEGEQVIVPEGRPLENGQSVQVR